MALARRGLKLGNLTYRGGSLSAPGTNQCANVWIDLVIPLFISVDSFLDTLLAATGIGTALKEANDTI